MRRNGQAAMEFLMTYGWAILVVLAAIGALAYLDVLSPSNFLPEECTFGTGIGCDNNQIRSDAVQFRITNSLQTDINNVNVSIDPGSPAICTFTSTSIDAGTLADGESFDAVFNCASGTITGRPSVEIDVGYTKAGETVNRTIEGSITGQVE